MNLLKLAALAALAGPLPAARPSTGSPLSAKRPRLTAIEDPTAQAGYQPGQHADARDRRRPPTSPTRCSRTRPRASSRTSAPTGSATSSPSSSPSTTARRSPTPPHASAPRPTRPVSAARSARSSAPKSPASMSTPPAASRLQVGIDRWRHGSVNRKESLADPGRRRRHPGPAQRQPRDRGPPGSAGQLRSPRPHRRRHRPPRGHPAPTTPSPPPRSPKPASPTAAAARSPMCSSRATASRSPTPSCPSDRRVHAASTPSPVTHSPIGAAGIGGLQKEPAYKGAQSPRLRPFPFLLRGRTSMGTRTPHAQSGSSPSRAACAPPSSSSPGLTRGFEPSRQRRANHAGGMI